MSKSRNPWDSDPDIPATNSSAADDADAGAEEAESAGGIEQLEQRVREAEERALRAQAELENTRRRLRRDAEEERKYATQSLLVDLLPVVDNIHRAIQAADQSADIDQLTNGVKMVAQQLAQVLEKHHCQRIDALGAPFDPQVHEAMTQQPTADVPPNTVVLVHQDGYRLHDRVIRPSQVVVSCAP